MHARALFAAPILLALAGCLTPPCADGVTAHPVPGHAIQVAWAAAENATAYFLLRGTDGGPLAPYAIVDASETSFTDANVTAGHAYAYAVTTAPDAPVDDCATATARLPDASVPFLAGPAVPIALAGGFLGALLLLARRR